MSLVKPGENMQSAKRKLAAVWLVVAALAGTAAVYWTGLSGPVLFDDYWNLAPVARWNAGEQSMLATLLPNRESVVFSRPVSMASFVLTTWLGGDGTFPLKLGNLLIHLLCGVAVWRVLRQLLLSDPRVAARAELFAAAAAAAWLLHPLHVSTVLYGVQRMAQLSALFTLTAVLAYLAARRRLEAGARVRALALLFVVFPFLCAVGILSKQNAAIAPLLCLVIELAYPLQRSQRRVLAAFFSLALFIPGIAAVGYYASNPQRLLAGYEELEFTLLERVLSQPRAIFDYVGMWFVPRTPRMGLYTDDFAISTGLLAPPTTLLALLALVGASIAALRMRASHPSVFVGWFLFLAAHAVESTVLPLEMYYEHRNYLPSIGLLLAAAAAIATALPRLAGSTGRLRRMLPAIAVAAVAVLAFSTFGRVLIWKDEVAMTEQGLRHHPESLRVHLDRTSLALRHDDYAGAIATLSPLLDSSDPRKRMVSRLDIVAIRCMRGDEQDHGELAAAVEDALPRVTVHEVHTAMLQEAITRNGACTTISPALFADSIVRIVEAAVEQSDAASNKTTMRRLAGQMYARADRWDLALVQAQKGWDAARTMPLGSLLVRANIHNDRAQEAWNVLAEMETLIRPFDTLWIQEMEGLRTMLERGEAPPAG